MAQLQNESSASTTRDLTRYEARVEQRSLVSEGDHVLSPSVYNLVMGGTVVYGLLLSGLIAFLLGDSMLQLVMSSRGAYWGLMIGYLACAFGGCYLASHTDRPLLAFLGYNLLVLPFGLMLSVYIPAVPVFIVAKAMALTGFITLFMMGLGSAFPRLFMGLGRTLFVSLLVTLVVEIVSVFIFGYSGMVFDYIFVAVFSLYIGYDFARSQAYQRTLGNAIFSAVDIYLDIINLFIRLLAILNRSNN